MKRKIVLFAALVMMFFAQKAFAGELCDKVGIKSVDDRVVIDSENDVVYVMQHPTSVVSSIVISPAKLKNAVASDSYTLSYVTEEKKSAPLSAKVFYDGYVKAVSKTDKTDILYIPIKMYRGEEQRQKIDEICLEQGSGEAGSAGGFGGAAVIASGKTFEDNIRSRYSGIIDTKSTYTFEFAFFAQNGAELKVGAVDESDENVLFTYKTDGTIAANSGETAFAERGKWHRAVLNYCGATKQYTVYIDGKALATESNAYDDAYRIMFSAGGDGVAAVADALLYRGYYYPDKYYKQAEISPIDEDALADDANIYIDLAGIANADELVGRFNTDAREYFTDADIGYGANLVLVSESGAFSYYRISLAVECKNVSFERKDNLLSISADVTNALAAPTDAVMVAVLKNSDGAVLDIAFSDAYKVDKNGAKIQIDNIACEGLSCEVFFVNTLDERTPLFETIYTEAED